MGSPTPQTNNPGNYPAPPPKGAINPAWTVKVVAKTVTVMGLQAVFFLLLSSTPQISWADPAPEERLNQRRIRQLEEELRAQRSSSEDARRREEELLAELKSLEEGVLRQRRELDDLNLELTGIKLRLIKKQLETQQTNKEYQQLAERIRRRLIATHRTGTVGLFNILFTAESLPELLSFQENLNYMVERDQQLMRSYHSRFDDLQADRRELGDAEAKLLTARQAVLKQEEELKAARRQLDTFLRRARTEKELHKKALQEIEKSASRLNTAGRSDKNATDDAAPGTTGSLPSLSQVKGELLLPVQGTVATRFGDSVTGLLGVGSRSRGVLIHTQSGAEVRTPFGGTVAYSGLMEGYGLLVIIDHGDDYFTLLARLQKTLVDIGERVERDQPVGLAAYSPGKKRGEVYLEIRNGVEPVDPLPWFRQR